MCRVSRRHGSDILVATSRQPPSPPAHACTARTRGRTSIRTRRRERMRMCVLAPSNARMHMHAGYSTLRGRKVLGYTKLDFIDYWADAETCAPVRWALLCAEPTGPCDLEKRPNLSNMRFAQTPRIGRARANIQSLTKCRPELAESAPNSGQLLFCFANLGQHVPNLGRAQPRCICTALVEVWSHRHGAQRRVALAITTGDGILWRCAASAWPQPSGAASFAQPHGVAVECAASQADDVRYWPAPSRTRTTAPSLRGSGTCSMLDRDRVLGA